LTGDDPHIKTAVEVRKTEGRAEAKKYLSRIIRENASTFSQARLAALRAALKMLGIVSVLSDLISPAQAEAPELPGLPVPSGPEGPSQCQ
jgi:MoxR-like ATPase